MVVVLTINLIFDIKALLFKIDGIYYLLRVTSSMVFFIVRGAAVFGIVGLTGLMWFQDHTKKVMVIKNTTQ